MNEHDFKLTNTAVEKVREGLAKRNTPDSALRVGIRSGCSGFRYCLEFDDNTPRDKDLVFEFDDVKVLVDKKSIVYLNGAELDWEKKLMSQGFKFNNPREKSSCGCGESFDID